MPISHHYKHVICYHIHRMSLTIPPINFRSNCLTPSASESCQLLTSPLLLFSQNVRYIKRQPFTSDNFSEQYARLPSNQHPLFEKLIASIVYMFCSISRYFRFIDTISHTLRRYQIHRSLSICCTFPIHVIGLIYAKSSIYGRQK